MQKTCQCIACENMKRRCDVIVFAKTDYDFSLDSVKEVLSKYNDDTKFNICVSPVSILSERIIFGK